MEVLTQGRAVAEQLINSSFPLVSVPLSLVFGPQNRHTGFIHSSEYTFSPSPGSLFAKESAHSSVLSQPQQILQLRKSRGSLCER